MIETKIKKWGNSAGIVLKQPLLEIVGLKIGSEILITVDPNQPAIIIMPKLKVKK